MPRGPRGERRPEDPAQVAVMVVRIATGEITEELAEKVMTTDATAVSLGRRGGLKGGRARADKLSSEKKQDIARAAANARWQSKPKA